MKKILIIEDEEPIRRVLKRILIDENPEFEISEAIDGNNAIDKSFWCIPSLFGENAHSYHHRHPRLVQRSKGIDLPYWLVLYPLEKFGLIWNLQ